MNKLPKELTPKLLGLVLNENMVVTEIYQPQNIEVIACRYTEIGYKYEKTNMFNSCSVNKDTLTRLMKEWIISDIHKEFLCSVELHQTAEDILISVTMFFDYDKLDNKKQFYAETEFEAVLKATEWIAKEKGLV